VERAALWARAWEAWAPWVHRPAQREP